MTEALTIRVLPDPVLRVVCDPVDVFDTALTDLTQAMLVAMYDAPGRGLAAPQVGITQRLFVMDAGWKDGTPAPQVFVNPRILARSDQLVAQTEGCLSIPDQTSFIARPDAVTVAWQDVKGNMKSGTFTGFEATCIQHEADHLDGILCIDYPEVEQ